MVVVVAYEVDMWSEENYDSVEVGCDVALTHVFVFDSRADAKENAEAIRRQVGRKATVRVMTADALETGGRDARDS